MSPLFPAAMAVTDFGESTVLLSTALAASFWLWVGRRRRLALTWLLATGGCALTMVILKLLFLTCGALVLDGAVHTPSGHSSMSALFYGAAALTVGRVSPPAARHRPLLLAAAFLFALAIGASRVVVHAHSPQEVAIGLLVGFSWLAAFAALSRGGGAPAAPPPASGLLVLAALYGGLLAASLSGEHVAVEDALVRVAHALQVRWDICPG